jgi:hypothetical protein
VSVGEEERASGSGRLGAGRRRGGYGTASDIGGRQVGGGDSRPWKRRVEARVCVFARGGRDYLGSWAGVHWALFTGLAQVGWPARLIFRAARAERVPVDETRVARTKFGYRELPPDRNPMLLGSGSNGAGSRSNGFGSWVLGFMPGVRRVDGTMIRRYAGKISEFNSQLFAFGCTTKELAHKKARPLAVGYM